MDIARRVHVVAALSFEPMVRHRALLKALQEQPEISLRLISALNAQLAHTRALMEVMGHKKAAEKIAAFILLMAPEVEAKAERFTLPFSRGGETVVTPESEIVVQEGKNPIFLVESGVSIGEVVNALNALGVSPRDLIAIFQALKAAGALQAELEII